VRGDVLHAERHAGVGHLLASRPLQTSYPFRWVQGICSGFDSSPLSAEEKKQMIAQHRQRLTPLPPAPTPPCLRESPPMFVPLRACVSRMTTVGSYDCAGVAATSSRPSPPRWPPTRTRTPAENWQEVMVCTCLAHTRRSPRGRSC